MTCRGASIRWCDGAVCVSAQAQAERMEVARRLQEQRAEEQRQQAASRRETIARAQARAPPRV
eukprot:6197723-Pleurochrysis_carterae.AAC.2